MSQSILPATLSPAQTRQCGEIRCITLHESDALARLASQTEPGLFREVHRIRHEIDRAGRLAESVYRVMPSLGDLVDESIGAVERARATKFGDNSKELRELADYLKAIQETIKAADFRAINKNEEADLAVNEGGTSPESAEVTE